ncbi:MAG: peptide MFS transporter [Tepidisphaeraceae bacterium]
MTSSTLEIADAAAAPSVLPASVRAGHPRGLFVLFIVEMWERFSYYGMRALLMLYLVAEAAGKNPGRGMDKTSAASLYGAYTGLAYLLPVFGGVIADKLIGSHRSVLIGGILITLGHVMLAVSGFGSLAGNDAGMSLFILGLALIVIGTGHFKPNVSVMVGQLYADGDPRRDSAFTIFYMGINVGAFISPLVCGTLGEWLGWHYGFGAAAVGMLLGLGVYLFARPRYLAGIGTTDSHTKANTWGGLFLCGGLVLAALAALAYHFNGFGHMTALLGRIDATSAGHVVLGGLYWLLIVGSLAAIVWFVAMQPAGDKGPTAVVLLFILFAAVFWLSFEQGGSSLNLFAKDLTQRNVGSFEVPATWFQSVRALEVILFAPLFAALWSALGRRGLNPSQSVKIAIALFLLGGGYLFMVAGSMGTSPEARASMFWLVATYTLHTLGELCISPTGLAFVTRVSPIRFVSLLMGLSFLSNSLANWAGGLLAGQIDKISSGEVQLFWYRWFRFGGQADFFFLFVVSSFGAGLLALALTPLIKRLLGRHA